MLNIRIEEDLPGKWTVALSGRLDTDAIVAFDARISTVLAPPPQILVFDMSELEFISSAGISALFRVQKQVGSAGGRTLMLKLQPQVSKVLEIVRTVDLKTVFSSVAELDAYLTDMQNKGRRKD